MSSCFSKKDRERRLRRGATMLKAFRAAACRLGGDDVTATVPWISASIGGVPGELIG